MPRVAQHCLVLVLFIRDDLALQVWGLDLLCLQSSSHYAIGHRQGLCPVYQSLYALLLVPCFKASSSASDRLMRRNLVPEPPVGRLVALTHKKAFLRYIPQMESCQVAGPAVAMNLHLQERRSGRLLQTGTQPRALQMTQIKGQGPWSLLQLELILASWRPGTT